MTDDDLPTAIGPEHLDDLTRNQFPTFVVDAIAKALTTTAAAEDDDLRAAFKAWGDLRGLAARAARIRVTDPTRPRFDIDVDGDRITLGGERMILIADTARYGTAEGGPVDVYRHERVFAGKTYNIALLHRDEAAKIPRETPHDQGHPET